MLGWIRQILAPAASAQTSPPASPPAQAAGGLSLHDLLGRPAVHLDTPEMQRFLAGKRVMVTGAGGSIGSEICRQAMKFCPQRVLLVERAENSLFEIDRELRHRWIGADLRPYLLDITDATQLRQVFETERPQVIFHCAAHKHVPLAEINAAEAVRNNVFGTKMLADAAAEFGAAAFVMVSTDKAVNPTSVMGATKRLAELYVQSLNPVEPAAGGATRTRFVAVRFGNVLGSSGSVVPIFQRQIEAGGPVTVTHPDMRRYFMTIAEASQLVMQAGAIGRGGEIFVLDMGAPVRILDLAKEMITRHGLRVGDDIEIQFTGVRPGEKLYEELSCDNEQIRPSGHAKIHVWELPLADADQVGRQLQRLRAVQNGTREQVLIALSACLPEFTSSLAPVPALSSADFETAAPPAAARAA